MSQRYLIAAIVFGVTLGFWPIHDAGSQEQSSQEHITVPPPTFGLIEQPQEPDRLTEPCEPGRDNRNSDLCAQWKAADAADNSASWAGPTFWLGIAGASIGTFTLLAAGVAAYFAKSAANAAWKTADLAKKSVDLADEANRITRENAEADRRPWIQVSFGLPNGVRRDKDGLRVDVVPIVRNIGKSIAYDVWVEAHAVLPGHGVMGNITTQFCTNWINVHNRRSGLSGPGPNGKVLFPNEQDATGTFPTIIKGDALHGIKTGDPEACIIPHVFVICTYKITATAKELRVTAKSFMITRAEDDGAKIICMKDLDVASNDVHFSDSMQPNYVT